MKGIIMTGIIMTDIILSEARGRCGITALQFMVFNTRRGMQRQQLHGGSGPHAAFIVKAVQPARHVRVTELDRVPSSEETEKVPVGTLVEYIAFRYDKQEIAELISRLQNLLPPRVV